MFKQVEDLEYAQTLLREFQQSRKWVNSVFQQAYLDLAI